MPSFHQRFTWRYISSRRAINSSVSNAGISRLFRASIFAIFIASIATSLALDFTTRRGKTFRDCHINTVTPSGLVITYAGELTTIDFRDLPPEIQTTLEYDPSKGRSNPKEAGMEAYQEWQARIRDYDRWGKKRTIHGKNLLPTPTPVAESTISRARFQPVATPTPEPVATPTPEPVATPTPEPVATPTPEPVATPTPEPIATPTAEPVATPTPNEKGLFLVIILIFAFLAVAIKKRRHDEALISRTEEERLRQEKLRQQAEEKIKEETERHFQKEQEKYRQEAFARSHAKWQEEQHQKAEAARKKSEEAEHRSKRKQEEEKREKEREQKNNSSRKERDPSQTVKSRAYYGKVLGLVGKVTMADVRKKYRELAAQYHPDKVNHLGEKLRKVAEQEMKEINEANEFFKKKYDL